jgi:glutamyl-tRNA reductase
MIIYACGLNYQTAPLPVREQLAMWLQNLGNPLQTLKHLTKAHGIALLSTCNRTEVYCASESEFPLKEQLLEKLTGHTTVLDSHLYCYQNEHAIEHIIRVASGLDSMVLGEPQITGQLKQAVAQSRHAGLLGDNLSQFFDYALHVGKLVRSETALNQKPLSIASVSVQVAKQIFADLSQVSALFIGVSQINQLALRHFYEHGMRQLWICNRTPSKAWDLAKSVNAGVIELSQIAEKLDQVDMVISATGAPHFLINHANFPTAKIRRRRPLLCLDLAVPRDICPSLADRHNVFLYTVDDLQHVIGEHRQARSQAAIIANQMIHTYTNHFIHKLEEKNTHADICAWRSSLEKIAAAELADAQHKLALGTAADDVLQRLTHRLLQKFMHQPTVQLKRLGYDQAFDQFSHLLHLLHSKD